MSHLACDAKLANACGIQDMQGDAWVALSGRVPVRQAGRTRETRGRPYRRRDGAAGDLARYGTCGRAVLDSVHAPGAPDWASSSRGHKRDGLYAVAGWPQAAGRRISRLWDA